MNLKRFVLATVGAFVTTFVMEFLIHGVWLSPVYKAHAQWWRPEAQMQAMMPLMSLAQLSFALLLTLVYAKGYESGKGGVGQGLRFGLMIGALLTVPNSLMNYVIYPYPSSLIMSWLAAGLLETILAGAVIGALYKPAK